MLQILFKLWSYAFIRYPVIIIISFIIGYYYGRYVQPAKVVTETKTVVKVVEKKVEVKKENMDIETTITETTLPDGTYTKVTKIVNKTKTDTTTNTDTNTNSNTTSNNSVVTEKSKWKANLIYSPTKFNEYNSYKSLGAGIEYRILGPIWAGAQVYTTPRVGLTLGVNF